MKQGGKLQEFFKKLSPKEWKFTEWRLNEQIDRI